MLPSCMWVQMSAWHCIKRRPAALKMLSTLELLTRQRLQGTLAEAPKLHAGQMSASSMHAFLQLVRCWTGSLKHPCYAAASQPLNRRCMQGRPAEALMLRAGQMSAPALPGLQL